MAEIHFIKGWKAHWSQRHTGCSTTYLSLYLPLYRHFFDCRQVKENN